MMKLRLFRVFAVMLGVMFSVAGLISCEDDPVQSEEPIDPEPDVVDPVLTDWHSWFDVDGQFKWPIIWTTGDFSVINGPGQYEYNLPASGGEFEFLKTDY